jgi:hypothetical protein
MSGVVSRGAVDVSTCLLLEVAVRSTCAVTTTDGGLTARRRARTWTLNNRPRPEQSHSLYLASSFDFVRSCSPQQQINLQSLA